jgi:nuclear pore complex protein Nup133
MRGDEFASGKFLERKAPVQVIFSKSRMEEDFLFSMHLRVSGKPAGSTMILSRDGTATFTHYWNKTTLLYQVELPWDAGKVIDASIIPSLDGGEE